jgi:protein TonB
MSYLDETKLRDRLGAVAGVGALHLALGTALLVGLAVNVLPEPVPEPIVVRLDPPRPVTLPPVETRPVIDEVQVTMTAPVIEVVPDTPPLPFEPPADPFAAQGAGSGAGGGEAVLPPVAEPVRVAARARPGLVGIGPDDYPEAARRAGEEERMTVRITIGADGAVTDCAVAASSGHERLDRRACEVAVRRWRFAPATEDGIAVPSVQEKRINWRLADLR